MYYLTDEDYATAEKNGISKTTAYRRYYREGWTVERTLTEPVIGWVRFWPKYKEICTKNGISKSTFMRRIKKGMPLEEAATTPTLPPGSYLNQNKKRRKSKYYTEEQLQIALANGIKRATLCARLYQYNWDVERAITEPVDTTKQRRNA